MLHGKYNRGMARFNANREDLIREATALVERVEIRVHGHDEPVVVGFRRDGGASFFLGADPVYQFNATVELRRAFIGGLLYKAERGRLVSLRRERSESETALIRHDLTPDEAEAFLAQTGQQLGDLLAALTSDAYQILRQIPQDAVLLPRIVACLQNLPAPIPIAAAPHAR
jgi:hypothetical protein